MGSSGAANSGATAVGNEASAQTADAKPSSEPKSADEALLAEWLSRPILEPDQAAKEIGLFVGAKLPRLQVPATREEWERQANALRRDVLDRVVFRGAPAQAWRDAATRVEWAGEIAGGEGYRIRKLRYEALPGLWIPALLYEPLELQGKHPVFVNVNGHDRNGKAADYKQIRCINMARRGVIALNLEWLHMGQLHLPGFAHGRLCQIDLCGTSGLAPFYLALSRGLDVALSHPHADPARVGVSGLSGGGWQTILISSLDTRVTLANPVAGYGAFATRIEHLSDIGDAEQAPVDLATLADYTHLTAMLAPRVALLTYNAKDDCCFKAATTLPPLVEAAAPAYALFGAENRLRTHVNYVPGTHNFFRENREALYRMIGEFFYAEQPLDAVEIDVASQVKTAAELEVPLPADNLDLHKLAVAVSEGLPRDAELPAASADAEAWIASRRKELTEVTRYAPAKAKPKDIDTSTKRQMTARWWRINIDGNGEWTMPAVEIARPNRSTTTGTPVAKGGASEPPVIVIDDRGRAAAADLVAPLVAAGRPVLVLDPLFVGEFQRQSGGYSLALLVSCVGSRPVGVQASQLAAAAAWWGKVHGGPPQLIARGPRTQLAALVAGALAGEAIGGVELIDPWPSLHEVLRRDMVVDDAPELFCFGLLERFDLVPIAALAAPRAIKIRTSDATVERAWSALSRWDASRGAQIATDRDRTPTGKPGAPN